jgi:formylglycine-generating enzyme required for sulfatase activity
MTEAAAPLRGQGRAKTIGASIAVGLAVAGALYAAARFGAEPRRCAKGSTPLGARCCGEGQGLEADRCVGEPTACPGELVAGDAGCVAPERRVAIAGSKLVLAPLDWEAAGQPKHEAEVAAFELDAFEVTEAAWARCAAKGACVDRGPREPGRAVAGVSLAEAEAYCAFAGGRLPSWDELALAASGPEAHRYPWGPTGLVCRRAVYGLVEGPCGRDASGPELAGSRPDGATPGGAFDLAGNVAEWTSTRTGDAAWVYGGSYRDGAAARLRTWAKRSESVASRPDDVGLRCAYDAKR